METVQNGTKSLSYKKHQFVRYIANMKRDIDGNKVSMNEFAQMMGLDRKTLYAWQNEEGFDDLVASEVENNFLQFLPQAGVIAKRYAAKGSFKHLELILKQAGKLKADKIDTKTEHSGAVSFTNQVPIQ